MARSRETQERAVSPGQVVQYLTYSDVRWRHFISRTAL